MAGEQVTIQSLFGQMMPEQARLLSDAAEKVVMAPGDIVFRQGDPATYFYSVVEGAVALYLAHPSGVSLEVDRVTPGTIFGSCVSVQRDTYATTAQCVEATRLLRIKAVTLKRLLDDEPLLGYTIQRLVSRVYFLRYLETVAKLQSVLHSLPLSPDRATP
jgi:CRP-like cAMP-binding protein